MTTGRSIGSYQILDKLGAGGMGDVYRARDTKLGRDVALKVLPPSFANDPDRVARFEREARTLASLNHPHIAHVYGFEPESSALVMELVPGDDLAARLVRGPLPIPEALAVARQIADALEFAHAHGVIHRDLKPANIKVRPDGTVKVLDFGLAKALSPLADAPEQLDAATMISPAMTMQGVILGTAAYMSPEQARGQAVDQRADIWAFGVVLYEMLTGRLAFAAPTVTDTLARVIERDPDWTALPAATPAPVRTLLRRCLEKDPRKRVPHIGLARLEFDDAVAESSSASGAGTAAPAASPRPTRARAAFVAGAVGLALAAAVAGYALRPAAGGPPVSPYRSVLLFDENMSARPPSHRFSISPDGRWLAYAGNDDQSREVRLWLRALDGHTSQPLTGTDGATTPFWSPDSRSIAYYANAQVWRLDVGGGPPVKVCDVPRGQLTSLPGAWGPDDLIVFSNGTSLWRVSARGGGRPEELTTIQEGETQHGFPWFLSGRRLLFTAYKGLDPIGVFALDVESRSRTRILEGGSNVQFADGRLIFVRGLSLVAQRFDPDALRFADAPVTLADPIATNVIVARAGAFSVSQTGAIVYIPLSRGNGSRLVWMTRDGRQTVVEDAPTSSRNLALSPDGLRATLIPMGLDGAVDVWLVDLKRAVRSRITHDVQPAMAVWSRDGRTIFYSARRDASVLNIYRRGDFGTGPEELVFASDVDKWLTSISADGRTLIYETQRPGLSWDVFALTLGSPPQVTALLDSAFSERAAQISPDGKWMAYTANHSGKGDEVYLATYPTGAHRTQVSARGGGYPRWHPLGRELFFHDGTRLVSAAVTLRPDGVDVGAVTPLFAVPAPEGFARAFYDIGPDGRFLITVPSSQSPSTRLALLTNWPAVAGR